VNYLYLLRKLSSAAYKKTPYDKQVELKIHAECDNVIRKLVGDLNIEVHPYEYVQPFTFKYLKLGDNQYQLNVESIRLNEPPKFIDEVIVCSRRMEQAKDSSFQLVLSKGPDSEIDVEFCFKPDYNEPSLKKTIVLKGEMGSELIQFKKVVKYPLK